jgi:Transposase, Mutator family
VHRARNLYAKVPDRERERDPQGVLAGARRGRRPKRRK